MFNNNGGYSLADIAAATGNDNNGGFGGFGGDGAWVLLLFIVLLAGGNWGNNGNYGGGGQGGVTVVSDVQRGFDQSALLNSLAGISTAVTTGFANAEVNRCNTQANLTALLNSIAMNQQNCCCENRAGIADLKYTIATENCADRAALATGVRDIIENQMAGIQSIKDMMCQDKIDAKNEEIARLRQEVYMKDLAASQIAQTAQIRAGQVAEIDAMYNRLRDCPVPTMPVYGMQPIFTYPNNGNNWFNNGCGCGCGA